ncbi:hypothetical protein LTR05_005525 [Lithohypha guttulata]|uniref:Major facilitator superfamily (MFS) profile domain-containing protein n=1 Tax=Lithohypha guttulata TaxID=1690604 RepID=A0AAN7YA33_9EURO|nr:hypothetical protein LTR05_005525 [Lithohypha guttulata]
MAVAQKKSVPWEDDLMNPYNWPKHRKYCNTLLLSAMTFNTLMSSTIVAPALPQVRKDLTIESDAQTQLVLAIYVLAYAIGYFIWAPMSEVYGRTRVLQIANVWFCVWTLICGFARNQSMIVVGRLFSGAGAAAALALGTGVTAEIWRPAQRGQSLAILSTITLLGPSIGPVLGGIIAAQSPSSWRWAFWSTTIFNAVLQLLALRFLHESHAQTIVGRRARKVELMESKKTSPLLPTSVTNFLLNSLKRPFYLLISQPASQALILYSGLSFGVLYFMLSVLTDPFTKIYGQSLIIASLNYISFGIGPTIGAQICGPVVDTIYRYQTKRHDHSRSANATEDREQSATRNAVKLPAEYRLYPLMPALILMTSGLLIFGWSLHYRLHWAVPNIGVIIFGAGNQAATQCTNAYMMDSFSEINSTDVTSPHDATTSNAAKLSAPKMAMNWTASAMASMWSVKALCGFAFPLFAVDTISALGWGWSSTLLAMLNLVVGTEEDRIEQTMT